MFDKEYSLDLVISAVVTMGVILMIIRIYLKIISKRSKIVKPDWLDDKRFQDKDK